MIDTGGGNRKHWKGVTATYRTTQNTKNLLLFHINWIMFIFNFEFLKNCFKGRKGDFLTLDVLMPFNQFNLLPPFYLFPSKAQNSTCFKTNS